jgi:hypothetical protein
LTHNRGDIRHNRFFRAISDAAKSASVPYQIPPSFLPRHIIWRQVFFGAISYGAEFSSTPYQRPLSFLPRHIIWRQVFFCAISDAAKFSSASYQMPLSFSVQTTKFSAATYNKEPEKSKKSRF